MAAKAELFRIPLWGRAMQASGFVRLDRKKGREARAALLEAGQRLSAEGLSLWVAPEGTRGPGEGRLLPFKTGAFALASALGLPILPVALRGTAAVLGKHRKSVHRGEPIGVSVLEPIAATSHRPAEELANELRTRLESELRPT
jgi:1-acyl-sn-glycerol-3-phosphate acyltransferase